MNIPPMPRPRSDWRDPATIAAAEGWVRIAIAIAFAAVLLYLLLQGRVDPTAFVKAILSILTIQSGANGALSWLKYHSMQKS